MGIKCEGAEFAGFAKAPGFLHAEADGLSVLLCPRLSHARSETVHPFLDGNGRVGRLRVALLLCKAALLRGPLLHLSLYFSLYFKEHRSRYCDVCNRIRPTGDREKWLVFFLEGVRHTAEGAVSTAQFLNGMFQADRNRIQNTSGRRAGLMLRIHDVLKESAGIADNGKSRITATVPDGFFCDGSTRYARNCTRGHGEEPKPEICL